MPEESEDMWHAYNLISEGDCVRASTIRSGKSRLRHTPKITSYRMYFERCHGKVATGSLYVMLFCSTYGVHLLTFHLLCNVIGSIGQFVSEQKLAYWSRHIKHFA